MTETAKDNDGGLPKLSFRRGLLAVLGVQLGGWLLFDGGRALFLGDYVRPQSGDHAGKLGPWSDLLLACGLEPLGLFAQLLHIVSGLSWLVLVGLTVKLSPKARPWLFIALPLGLWYLPWGTGIAIACAIMHLGDPDLRSRAKS